MSEEKYLVESSMSDTSIKKHDLYIYDLPEALLNSLDLLQFDSYRNEVKPKPVERAPVSIEEVKNKQVPTVLKCKVCADSTEAIGREHYQTDLHVANIRRNLNGLPPLNQAQFEELISKNTAKKDQNIVEGDSDGDISNDSGNDSDSNYSSEDELEKIDEIDGELSRKVNEINIIDKPITPLLTHTEDSEANLFHLNTGLPQILVRSPLLSNGQTYGIYKALFDKDNIQEPLDTILKWNMDDTRMTSISALFLVGGGHFAGAIVCHQRGNIKSVVRSKRVDETPQEQCVQFLEHKTFHRYTTRRKQGGSQSAMDNAKGKANSAGSTLRRYNEAALKTDIQNLMEKWRPYLNKCESIYIRARNVQDKKIFLDGGILNKDDKRIKSFPFTTNRPTVTELKRIWCELTYMKPVEKPQPIPNEEASRKAISKPDAESKKKDVPKLELSEAEVHTEQIVTLLKKSRVPLLLSYLKKNKLDGNFILLPRNKYVHTPTMLHYASQQGLRQMVSILLTTVKCDPTIPNDVGKTAWDISKNDTVRYCFQKARHALGEEYTNWEEAHVGVPLSKEEVERLESEKEKQDEAETKKLIQKELELTKERQKQERSARADEIELKHGQGRRLDSGSPGLMNLSSHKIDSLNEDQRRRLMREQRARAAEARMQKLNK